MGASVIIIIRVFAETELYRSLITNQVRYFDAHDLKSCYSFC